MITIEELQKKKAKLNEHMRAMIATADGENRDLTDAEQADFDAADDAFKVVERDIKNRLRVAEQEADLSEAAPRATKPDGIGDDDNTTTTAPPRASGRVEFSGPKGHWGWK